MYWEYVVPGYLIVFATLAIYTLYVVRKGRALSQQLPPEKRRFLD